MVGRDVSAQPPWSMAMSTKTLPGFIDAQHRARDQLRRTRARHQHGADEQVDRGQQLGQVRLGGVKRVRGAHRDVEKAHALEVDLEDR